MLKRKDEILQRAGYYVETAIWSSIAIWVIGWFIYIRIIAEKPVTDIPSKSHPFLALTGHVLILTVLIIVSVLMPIVAYRKETPVKYKPNQWPRVKTAWTILKNITYYPFFILYFRIIEKIPHLYTTIQQLWEQQILKKKSEMSAN